MKLPRTSPVIGWPLSVAIGISIRMRPAAGTSHCHPIQSSEKPWRISAPLPNSASRRRIRRSRRLLEGRQNALAAAVAGLVEQTAVALARIDRLQHVEVGGDFDQALRVSRRELQIDDDVVGGKVGIEGEVDLADEFLVRRRRRRTAGREHDFAALDAQPGDAGVAAAAVAARSAIATKVDRTWAKCS